MSIAIMSTVWSKSQHKGNALLLLLAIADNADDSGWCWPGIEYLAKKVKVTPQSIIRITKSLEGSHELTVLHNRRTGNKYIVRLGMTDAKLAGVLRAKASYLSEEQITNILLHNTCVTSEVTDNVSSEVTSMLDESSITTNEPSHVADATPALGSIGALMDQRERQNCKDCGESEVAGSLIDDLCESCYGEMRDEADRENEVLDVRFEPPLWPWECAVCGKKAAINKDNIVNCPYCDASYHRDSAPNQEPPICPDCLKHTATTADMPYKNQTCTCEHERELAAAFGDPKPSPAVEVTPAPHWTEQAGQPWASWGAESDEFQRQLQRFGDSGRIVQELGYKLERTTNLKPLWDNKKKVKSWSSGLWELYQEAGCSIDVAIEAAKALKESRMTVTSPYSVANMARALAAEKSQRPKRVVIK